VAAGLGVFPARIEGQVFLRGDANGDGKATISDAHFSLSFLFRGSEAPKCLRAADLDGNQNIDLSDAVELLNYLFLGGGAPCEPFPQPGTSPFNELIPCEEYVVGPTLADDAAAMKVANAIAGPDGRATINISVSSSRDLAGYSAVLRLEGARFGSVLRSSELTGTLAGGFFATQVFGGKIRIGFLSSLIGTARIEAGLSQPVAQVEVCLEAGVAAGDLQLQLESAELADFESGRAIIPRLIDDVLALPVDVGATGCQSPDEPGGVRRCENPNPPDPPIPPGGPTLNFARGDVNLDGAASIADALRLRNFIFNGGPIPPCVDAADTNDDGRVNGADTLFLFSHLYLDGPPPPPPFLISGPDPTPDSFGCASDQIKPPAPSEEDILRLGEGEGLSGGAVSIPVILTNAAEVEAFQLVIRFDPDVLRPDGQQSGIGLQGGFFETKGLGPQDSFVAGRLVPGHDDIFLLAFIPHQRSTGFEVPPGADRLVFSIRALIAPGLNPGVLSPVELTNGAGSAGFGELKLRNELSSRGETRLPRLVSGSIRTIEGRPILRGDANHDGRIDLSDSIFNLNFLFLGGPAPVCDDEADADDNGQLQLTDSVVILNTLFLGTVRIAPPFPNAGVDTTADELPECFF
jgi:hypothetical protein